MKRIGRERRTAAIVGIDNNVREIEDLANSAGLDVVFELVQWRRRPDSSTYVGRGKLEDSKIPHRKARESQNRGMRIDLH